MFIGGVRLSKVVLGLLLLATFAAMLRSGRPWRGYNIPRVAEIATLPETEALAPVRRYTKIGAGLFPWVGGVRPQYGRGEQPVKLGYAYLEYGILGMPYWVGEEYGLVTYIEQAHGIRFAGIAPGQRPLLDEMVGRPITRDYRFNRYFRLWGWFFPVAFFAFIFLWWREDRQEETRLMEGLE